MEVYFTHFDQGQPKDCPVSCQYTEQLNTLSTAHGVVFHIPGFWGKFPTKYPNQALHEVEPL
jgi:hypothetical protein